MKQSAQKCEKLSLVPSDKQDSGTAPAAKNLRDTFDGWLNSVAPTLTQANPVEDRPNVAERLKRRTLTLTEATRVNFATVREGTEHGHWPPEVVMSFLAAEVIKRKPE